MTVVVRAASLYQVIVPDAHVPARVLDAPAHIVDGDAEILLGVVKAGQATVTSFVQLPVPCEEVIVKVLVPALPVPSYVIGMAIEVCEAVKVVVNVPENPAPDTSTVTGPAVTPVMGMVSVPVCPAVPFAVNVPV